MPFFRLYHAFQLLPNFFVSCTFSHILFNLDPKAETGVSSLQELLGAYLTEEETNFEAYQLINKLNAELDAQESAKNAMVEEIAKIEQQLREQVTTEKKSLPKPLRLNAD